MYVVNKQPSHFTETTVVSFKQPEHVFFKNCRPYLSPDIERFVKTLTIGLVPSFAFVMFTVFVCFTKKDYITFSLNSHNVNNNQIKGLTDLLHFSL